MKYYRLIEFGHVTRIEKDNIHISCCLDTHMDDCLEGDQGNGGWTTLPKIVKT